MMDYISQDGYVENSIDEYPYPFLDENGDVICQICGKKFKTITPQHLNKSHDITMDVYKSRFPKAPLVSKQTILKQNYTKIHGKEEKVIEETKTENQMIQEVENIKNIPDNSINLDDYDISAKFKEDYIKKQKEVKEKPPVVKTSIEKTRDNIESQLKGFFLNIQKNYFVTKVLSNRLVYNYITDYADPILKVIVNFPDTFWHNRERYNDPNKNDRLRRDGWKVIEILKNENISEKIQKELQKK